MAFDLWATPFVGTVTTIGAEFLNKMRTELARAVDGLGGTYTPTADLIFGGSADIELGGTGEVRFTSTQGVTNLVMGGTHQVEYTARSLTRILSLELATPVSGGFTISTSGSLAPCWIRSGGVGGILWVPIPVPLGATLESVEVRFDPAPHSDVPATKPGVEVFFGLFGSSALSSSLGASTPFAGSLAAYVAGYTATATVGVARTVDSSRFWARVTGESGTDSEPDLVVTSVQATYTVTSQDEALVF
jgi:hypothetical protein